MAVIGREAARAPLTSADINDGIVSAADLAATLDLSSKTLTLPSLSTVDINGGTIDGVTIGGSSAGAITGTNLAYTGTLTGGTGVINIGSGQVYKDDSGNDGIGTSSPVSFGANTAGLTINGSSGSHVTWQNNGTNVAFAYNVGNDFKIGSEQAGSTLGFNSSGATRMTIDAGGSVLIGKTTPADLHDTWNHIIIGEKGAIISENGAGGIDGITLADNAYIDSDTGTYAYQTTAAASQITQSGGVIAFSNAASGSAGAALTPVERMRIDSSGSLLLGTTSNPGGYRLEVYGDAHVGVNSENRGLYIGPHEFTASLRYNGNGNFEIAPRSGYSTVFLSETSGSERMRIDSSGNVGIGQSAPYNNSKLDVLGSIISTSQTIASYAADNAGFDFAAGTKIGRFFSTSSDATGGHMTFVTGAGGGSERMRLDSSGNLLVGKTATAFNTNGVELRPNGAVWGTVTGQGAASFNIKGTDGVIADFYKDGTVMGSIGTGAGAIYIGSGSQSSGISFFGTAIYPNNGSNISATDGANDIGAPTARWKDLYRSGSTISTSDRNMKQDERPLTDAEAAVAQACKGLLKAFRFIDAVKTDGDGARIHFGIIAQDLQAAFEAEGLDANNYAMFRPSTFTDDEGNEQTRLGVCYENLLAFIIAAL